MNHPYPLAAASSPTTLTLMAMPPGRQQEDVDFRSVLDTVFNARRLILAVTAVALLIGAAYALLSPPIYRADAMIQVEQNQNEGNNHVLGALSSAFNIQSPATAEMEILRSRLVLGEAVNELQLYISAQPNYLPVIGRWLSKHADILPAVDIPWLHNYVWGTESIQLAALSVPKRLESQALTLVATDQGYELLDPNGALLTNGIVGTTARFDTADGSGSILVSHLQADPGAHFTVTRYSQLDIMNTLQKALIIDEMSKPSGILSMSLEGTDPARVAAVLNAIGAAYVEQNIERKAAEAQKSLTFLDSFLPQLKKQMDDSNNRYTDFRDRHGTFDLGTEGALALNSSVELKTQIFALQQKRRELIVQYGASHPAIRGIDQQIAAAEQEVSKLTTRIKGLPDMEQQLLNLSRDVKVNGELYASLLNSTQQLRLVKEGKVGNVRMVDRAIVPERPVKPKQPLVLTVAGTLGLLLGTALALLRGMLGCAIKGASDIESRTGLAVYATVPRIQPRAQRRMTTTGRHQPPTRVLAVVAPEDPAIESLRSLRTSLRPTLRTAANNIIMLTGPTPDIGKTFTSVNLAALLGSAYKRVLLVDTDFRSGGIHRQFNLRREGGFSEMINGESNLEQVVHRGVLHNVDFISTGRLPANPAEVFLSEAAEPLLDLLSQRYDVVVLDTAPVLPVSDAMALAPLAGTIFVLARADMTTMEELEESAKRIRQAGGQVHGVILNDFNPGRHRFNPKYGAYRQNSPNYGS